MGAEIVVRHRQFRGELSANEFAHLRPQRLAFGRELDRIETESGAHRALSGGGIEGGQLASDYHAQRSGRGTRRH
jgi:hypothetical protein